MNDRDNRDATRQIAPLLPASDALIIDSTHMPAQEVVEQVLEHAKKMAHFLVTNEIQYLESAQRN